MKMGPNLFTFTTFSSLAHLNFIHSTTGRTNLRPLPFLHCLCSVTRPSSGPIFTHGTRLSWAPPPSKAPPTRSPVGRLAVSVELALAQQEALVLHCVSGRSRRGGGGASLGRGGARAPASPALTPLSWPRPPSRLGPVPRPRPIRPRCPLGRLKPVGQAAGGKLARLRQRRLCE
jgi:hypothetical protein